MCETGGRKTWCFFPIKNKHTHKAKTAQVREQVYQAIDSAAFRAAHQQSQWTPLRYSTEERQRMKQRTCWLCSTLLNTNVLQHAIKWSNIIIQAPVHFNLSESHSLGVVVLSGKEFVQIIPACFFWSLIYVWFISFCIFVCSSFHSVFVCAFFQPVFFFVCFLAVAYFFLYFVCSAFHSAFSVVYVSCIFPVVYFILNLSVVFSIRCFFTLYFVHGLLSSVFHPQFILFYNMSVVTAIWIFSAVLCMLILIHWALYITCGLHCVWFIL